MAYTAALHGIRPPGRELAYLREVVGCILGTSAGPMLLPLVRLKLHLDMRMGSNHDWSGTRHMPWVSGYLLRLDEDRNHKDGFAVSGFTSPAWCRALSDALCGL